MTTLNIAVAEILEKGEIIQTGITNLNWRTNNDNGTRRTKNEEHILNT